MNSYLVFIFIFFIGSTIGWVFELLLRRIYHKKWVNPGFLVGPYLPIYGFGLVLMTIIHNVTDPYNLSPIFTILITGSAMTLIELVTGLIFLKQGIRLWDYRDRKFNYKGVICPLFSFIWTGAGALYYYFIEERLVRALSWFSENLSFSYVLGLFTGLIVVDFFYSTKLYKKIKKYAKNNDIDIIYEKLKEHIKDVQKEAKEKYSFVFPFKQTGSMTDYLNQYKEKIKRR